MDEWVIVLMEGPGGQPVGLGAGGTSETSVGAACMGGGRESALIYTVSIRDMCGIGPTHEHRGGVDTC